MRERVKQQPVLAIGLLLVVVQGVFRWWQLGGGFFWQDDFVYLDSTSGGPALEVLLQDYNGHLMPGSFLLSWLVGVTGSSYAFALVLLLLLQAATGFALLWLIQLLFPARALGPVVLAGVLFTPLTLVGVTWFAYGLQLFPMQLTLILALGSYVCWRRTGARRWALATAGAYLAGLFFWEKSALVVPILALFAFLVLDRDLSVGDRLRTLLREWRLWSVIAVISLCYLVLYLARIESVATQGDQGRTVSLVTFANNALLRTLLPGLLGGPWTAAGSATTLGGIPSDAVAAVVVLVWVLIIGASYLWRGKAAVQAWLWVAVVVVLSYGLLVAYRPYAEALARDSRYIADIIPVAAIAVLAAFLPVQVSRAAAVTAEEDGQDATAAGASGQLGSTAAPAAELETSGAHHGVAAGDAAWPSLPGVNRDLRLPLAGFAALALFASGWVSMAQVKPELINSYSRNYVESMRRSVTQDPQRPLLDSTAPTQRVLAGYNSQVTRAMGLAPRWVTAGRGLQMFDGIARSGPVTISETAMARRGPVKDCGWLVRPGSPLVMDVPAINEFFRPAAQVGFVSQRVNTLLIQVDQGAPVRVQTDGVLGVVTLALPKKPRQLTISTPYAGAVVCVSDVKIGTPVAKIDP